MWIRSVRSECKGAPLPLPALLCVHTHTQRFLRPHGVVRAMNCCPVHSQGSRVHVALPQARIWPGPRLWDAATLKQHLVSLAS